jgi:hypothetical protein
MMIIPNTNSIWKWLLQVCHQLGAVWEEQEGMGERGAGGCGRKRSSGLSWLYPVSVYIQAYIYICICIYVSVYMHLYMCICIYISLYICVSVCMYQNFICDRFSMRGAGGCGWKRSSGLSWLYPLRHHLLKSVANVLPMCCQCVANVLLTPVLRGNTFSKVLSLVTLSGKYTRALTSENFCFVFKDSAIMYRSEGMFVQAFAMLDEVCCVSNVLLMCW